MRVHAEPAGENVMLTVGADKYVLTVAESARLMVDLLAILSRGRESLSTILQRALLVDHEHAPIHFEG